MKRLTLIITALILMYGNLSGQTFTRVTTGDIVIDGGCSYGNAWGDYDNDGYIDLFVANNGCDDSNFLYHNNGDGSFTKIFAGYIVNDNNRYWATTWGDYDNDGDLDLFVANFWQGENSTLYQNNGDGTFNKITSGIVVNDGGDSSGCSWVDYDNDGDLDLFVTNVYGQNNFFYSNDGDGTFTKITSVAIANDRGESIGCGWGDCDNDGDLDLFVANGGWRANLNNLFYKNNSNGTFTKITNSIIVEDGGRSTGCSWGDYDNDGYLDLFVTNGCKSVNQNNFLYRNNGGTFTKITSGAIVNDGGNSLSSSWGDIDNDGDLDLYVTNAINKSPSQKNFLYSNNGDGTFTKITSGIIVNATDMSLGVSMGDYDNDGDLDIFYGNDNGHNNSLFRNNGNSNNWINIKCIGTVSNTSAIGAKVRVKAKEFIGKANRNVNSFWQLNEISGQTGGGYGGQNSLNAEFGLGDATKIDSIRIEWPSGIVELFTDVPANQFVVAVEGNSVPVAVNDTITTPEDTPIIFATSTLLTNDTDADGDTRELQSIDTTGIVGTITIDPGNTTITYTPAVDFNGNDTFTYTIIDSNLGGTGTGMVVVTVTPVNDAPVAVGDAITTPEDTPVTIATRDVLVNDTDIDGDALVVQSIDTTGTIGTAEMDPGDTTITYTPAPDFNGNDTFIYTSSDGNGGSDTAVVSVTVMPVNDRPVAVNDTVTTPEDNIINIAVLSNDTDIDGDGLIVQSIDTTGTLGTVGINPGNITITYTPRPNFNGNDTFTYTINDYNLGGNDTAMVFVTVIPSNDAPVAVDDTVTTPEDTLITFAISALLANDIDVEGDTLLLQSIAITDTKGTVIINPDTTITYTPEANFNGDDSFIYIIVDGNGGIDTAIVVVTVTAIQDEPLPFELIYPVDDATIDTSTITFLWQKPFDPDPDEMTYTLYLSGAGKDTTFSDLADTVLIYNGFTFFDVDMVYDWSVEATDGIDTVASMTQNQFRTASVLVGVNMSDQIPEKFGLHQNYPNPFNPETIIQYHLPMSSDVELLIYNIRGQKVRTLLNERQNAGYYDTRWDGKDDEGKEVPGGVYLYRLVTGEFVQTKKMLLLR